MCIKSMLCYLGKGGEGGGDGGGDGEEEIIQQLKI